MEFGILAGAGHFHTAALAAAPGVNLCLDDDARSALGKQIARHSRGFFEGVSHFAPGHGNAVFCQDFFCLILVYLQCFLEPSKWAMVGSSEPDPVDPEPARPCQR